MSDSEAMTEREENLLRARNEHAQQLLSEQADEIRRLKAELDKKHSSWQDAWDGWGMDRAENEELRERVRDLRLENKKVNRELGKAADRFIGVCKENREIVRQNAELGERVRVLEEALRFYADVDNYCDFADEASSDADTGEIARAALFSKQEEEQVDTSPKRHAWGWE